ncbi:MAG: SufB/SufD family protein [Bilifractor sp.]
MESMNMTINRLPAYTYNWLHLNVTHLSGVRTREEAPFSAEVPEGITRSAERFPEAAGGAYGNVLTGSGEDVDALVKAAGVPVNTFAVPEGKRITGDAVRISLNYEDQGFVYDARGGTGDPSSAGKVNAYALVLGENSEMTVVMDYSSEAGASGLSAVQTKIFAAKNSVLHLVQIQRLGSGFTLLNDIGGECGQNARVEVIRLILSGKNTYDGCRVALAGDESSLGVDIGYLVAGDGRLDMNYDAFHTGKKTSCEINAAGVLRDRAFKLFRGTIDFQTGCSGSTGDEMEDVLLMDDGVVNQTIPLILCAEEDVVGNHGATIGRLDEDLMFYMEARGMNREEIYEMMAKARVDAVIRKIPDPKTRDALSEQERE